MRQGNQEEALRDYLWAFDHGKDVAESFIAARRKLVDKILNLGGQYPPAKMALAERLDVQAKAIVRAAETGQSLESIDLALFVWLGTRIGDEPRVRATYHTVKSRLPVEAPLRLRLWAEIEQHLVAQRRYQDAVAEPDGLAVVKYYLTALNTQRTHEQVREAIAFTIENECASHFEALLGAGQTASADSLANELIQFAATARTFAALIRHARRAGAIDVATRLREKANEIVPETERKILDDAMTGVMKEAG